jgi:hypothetical protein
MLRRVPQAFVHATPLELALPRLLLQHLDALLDAEHPFVDLGQQQLALFRRQLIPSLSLGKCLLHHLATHRAEIDVNATGSARLLWRLGWKLTRPAPDAVGIEPAKRLSLSAGWRTLPPVPIAVGRRERWWAGWRRGIRRWWTGGW